MEKRAYEKRLSVVIPVYNTAPYLRECLDSVMAQTAGDTEVLLVDDGSTDGSGLICDEYAAGYDAVRVFHTENRGQSPARKTGVSAARGRYIGFVDSDDRIDPGMYEEMLSYAEGNALDMVCCGLVYEKGDSGVRRYNVAAAGVYEGEAVREKLLPGALAYGTDYSSERKIEPHLVDKLIKKEIVEDALSGIDERICWGEDALSVLRCLLRCERIGIVESCPYHYRLHGKSVSVKADKRAVGSYGRLLESLLELAEGSEVLRQQVRYYAVTALRDMLRIGFGIKSGKFWHFPYADFEKGIRLALYGAGDVGSCYHAQVSGTGYFAKADLFDSKPEGEGVKGAGELHAGDYDMVVIAVEKEETAQAIRRQLMQRGIAEGKLYWKKPEWVRDSFRFRP